MTTTPADLKKSGRYFESAMEAEPNDKRASIGSVPSAKASIMNIPDRNDPLEMATACMDWVKPQGKKKVPIPSSRGATALDSA